MILRRRGRRRRHRRLGLGHEISEVVEGEGEVSKCWWIVGGMLRNDLFSVVGILVPPQSLSALEFSIAVFAQIHHFWLFFSLHLLYMYLYL